MTHIDPPENLKPNVVHRKLVDYGNDWADRDAAASLLEELKRTTVAQLKLKSSGTSESARETDALASEVYYEHIKLMVDARKEANKARVAYQSIQTWIELERTKQVNERIERKNGNIIT